MKDSYITRRGYQEFGLHISHRSQSYRSTQAMVPGGVFGGSQSLFIEKSRASHALEFQSEIVLIHISIDIRSALTDLWGKAYRLNYLSRQCEDLTIQQIGRPSYAWFK
jgi:hypothetical protein